MKAMREQLKAGQCENLSIDIEVPSKANGGDKNNPIGGIAFDISSANIASNDFFNKLKAVGGAASKRKDVQQRLKISEARYISYAFYFISTVVCCF